MPCCWPRSRPSASSSRPSSRRSSMAATAIIIQCGHRRVAQAIAAELDEIRCSSPDRRCGHDAMRALVENVAREPLNPVDLWRSIERLVALGWTEESIAHRARPARASGPEAPPARQRPAGDARPDGEGRHAEERQLRVIAAASTRNRRGLEEVQAEEGRPARLLARRRPRSDEARACMRATRASTTISPRPMASSGGGPVRAGRRGQPLHDRR